MFEDRSHADRFAPSPAPDVVAADKRQTGDVPALELYGATVSYNTRNGPMMALDKVNLSIAKGSFLSLIGPSGCGKSTILNLLAGYLMPTDGNVLCLGERITGPGPDRMVVHQQSTALLPWLTVGKNVELALKARKVPRQERQDIVRKYLTLVSLDKFADHPIYHISGGMQQRVALARALATEAPVVLLDEPLGAIDALQREIMQNLLLEIWGKTKRTFVLVTHSVEEAVYLSTDIVVMSPRPGRVMSRSSVNFGARTLAQGIKAVKEDPAFMATQTELLDQLIQVQKGTM
jgi:taurine transport system ATP-binding protein